MRTCWGPSPLTMAWGGGDARIGSSELRSWPDSRGGVWSAISPSFTPLKSYSCKTEVGRLAHTQDLHKKILTATFPR